MVTPLSIGAFSPQLILQSLQWDDVFEWMRNPLSGPCWNWVFPGTGDYNMQAWLFVVCRSSVPQIIYWRDWHWGSKSFIPYHLRSLSEEHFYQWRRCSGTSGNLGLLYFFQELQIFTLKRQVFDGFQRSAFAVILAVGDLFRLFWPPPGSGLGFSKRLHQNIVLVIPPRGVLFQLTFVCRLDLMRQIVFPTDMHFHLLGRLVQVLLHGLIRDDCEVASSPVKVVVRRGYVNHPISFQKGSVAP